MGRHHCWLCGRLDIDPSRCNKCGAGSEIDMCSTCSERHCMTEGKQNRLYDVDIVKQILRVGKLGFETAFCRGMKVATPSLCRLLQDWLREHDVEDHKDDGKVGGELNEKREKRKKKKRKRIAWTPSEMLEIELFGSHDSAVREKSEKKRRYKKEGSAKRGLAMSLEERSLFGSSDISDNEMHEADFFGTDDESSSNKRIEKELFGCEDETDSFGAVASGNESTEKKGNGMTEMRYRRNATTSESEKRKLASAPPSRDADVSSYSDANNVIGKFVDLANDSDASGTSRGSVAILEPEDDIEFRGAPY